MALKKVGMEGKIFNVKGSDLIIEEYVNCDCVYVKFLDTGYRTKTRLSKIQSGIVKDKLKPSLFGVGFIGDGEADQPRRKEAYKRWFAMISRCYNKDDERHEWYRGVEVCEEWHNFQNFVVWYEDNCPKDGMKYELDKDILSGEEKVYSPLTCCFVSKSENMGEAVGVWYRFKSPSGKIFEGKNISELCRLFGLNRTAMASVMRGRNKTHNGWTKA